MSISTPAGSSRFIRASTVFWVGFMMSIRRLWVRRSNCSRLDLFRGLVDELMVVRLEADADHFLVACGCHVLSSVTKCSAALALPYGFARMRLPYTVPCVSNPVRKTNRLSPARPAQVIYAAQVISAARLSAGTGPAADILHGSYRSVFAPQSPASSHNTPMYAQALI